MFIVNETPLHGLMKITRKIHWDERGFFSKIFCAKDFEDLQLFNAPIQVNYSFNEKLGTVRGLHYQAPPYMEKKLVSCVRGKVWDVAIDLRKASPTFLHWHAEVLSADNGISLLIPEGFGHGFQTLEEGASLIYCHSQIHVPSGDTGLNPLDPVLKVEWPTQITSLSEKDRSWTFIDESFQGVKCEM
jgi:dTDP-4-dehydrorhamnose 3,5-epimerase